MILWYVYNNSLRIMAERISSKCHLCGKSDENLSSVAKWDEESRSFIMHHLRDGSSSSLSEVNTNIWVCKKHYLEAKRHRADRSYTPKWKINKKYKTIISCMYPNCSNTNEDTNIIKATFASKDRLIEAMGLRQQPPTEYGDVTVCKTHYSRLYMEINPIKCSMCNGWPKRGMTFTHHSPDCETVSQYLNNDSTRTHVITPNDLLCQTCYEIHASIIKFMDCQPNNLDDKLSEDIEIWEMVLTDTSSSINKLTRAVRKCNIM